MQKVMSSPPTANQEPETEDCTCTRTTKGCFRKAWSRSEYNIDCFACCTLVSYWILTSCQSHRVISRQAHWKLLSCSNCPFKNTGLSVDEPICRWSVLVAGCGRSVNVTGSSYQPAGRNSAYFVPSQLIPPQFPEILFPRGVV